MTEKQEKQYKAAIKKLMKENKELREVMSIPDSYVLSRSASGEPYAWVDDKGSGYVVLAQKNSVTGELRTFRLSNEMYKNLAKFMR